MLCCLSVCLVYIFICERLWKCCLSPIAYHLNIYQVSGICFYTFYVFRSDGHISFLLWSREPLRYIYWIINCSFTHSCPVEHAHQKGVLTTQSSLQARGQWSAYNKYTFLQHKALCSSTSNKNTCLQRKALANQLESITVTLDLHQYMYINLHQSPWTVVLRACIYISSHQSLLL